MPERHSGAAEACLRDTTNRVFPESRETPTNRVFQKLERERYTMRRVSPVLCEREKRRGAESLSYYMGRWKNDEAHRALLGM